MPDHPSASLKIYGVYEVSIKNPISIHGTVFNSNIVYKYDIINDQIAPMSYETKTNLYKNSKYYIKNSILFWIIESWFFFFSIIQLWDKL